MKKSFVFGALFLCLALALFFKVAYPYGAAKEGPCAFCTEKVLSSQLLFEGEEVLALTTHKPAREGHILIIPKRHVERFEDLTSSEIAEMGEMVKKVNRAVQKTFHTTGYLLIQKNGAEAGQSVFHVHFHYLPAEKNQNQLALAFKFLFSPWLSPKTAEEMGEEIALLKN